MKKVILLTLSMYAYFLSFSQSHIDCNCDELSNRKYAKLKSKEEINWAVAITCRIDFDFLEKVNKAVTSQWKYIQDQQDKKEKANMDGLIEVIKDYKKTLASFTQLKETNKLEKYIYCYFEFLIKIYTKAKYIVEKYDLEEGIDKLKILFIYNEKEEDERNSEIVKEIKKLLSKNR